jgi:hypothetical protein
MSLRIPLPEAPAGSVMQGALQTNALSRSNLDNQIVSAQAQYAPYTSYADAALKMAQAQVAAPQVISNILSNPLGVSRMTPDTYNALVGMAQRGLQNIGNLNIPQPGQMGGSPLGRVYNWLRNLTSGGGTPSPNNSLALQQAMANQTPGQAITIGANGQPIVSNYGNQGAPASPASPAGGGYNTSASQQAGSMQTPGTMGGINPLSAAEAQSEGFKTAATSQAQAATQQWNEGQTQISNNADLMNNLINNAKGFDSAYQKSFYRGARLGSLPSEGVLAPPTLPGHDLSNEQITDRYANQMVTSLASAYQKGHVTDSNFGLFSRLKLARALDPDAEQSIYNSTVAAANRVKENRDFYNYIRRQNPDVTKPEADGLFGLYNTQMPPYDFNTLKPLPQNANQWKSYASPQALDQYRDTGTFNPSPQQSQNQLQQQAVAPSSAQQAIQQQGQSFKNQMIKMQGTDPKDGKMKIWQVPQGKVQSFLDNGFKRAY